MTPSVLLETALPNRAHRGKVRDLYNLGCCMPPGRPPTLLR
jgi:hypothetical protein